jgi:photosystem II stability/assembly factor-like uncharacterized protein
MALISWARLSTRPLLAAALAAMVGFGAVVTFGSPEDDPVAWSVEAPLAPQSLLLDVAARDGVLVTVGERGHVLLSSDGGRTWTQARVPTRALLTGVFMHDRRLGWVVGHDEVILRTRDGGATWERVHHAPENERPLLDVWFADEHRGLATGAYGQLLETRDGGDSWEPRIAHEDHDFHLNQIASAPDGALYVAGEAGHLYRSDDGGETWQTLTSPYEGSFFGTLPLSDGTVLAFGLRGHLFRSADRGRSWQQIPTDSEATLLAGLELEPGRFVLVGMEGTLLWSEGPGGPVRLQEMPDRRPIVALARDGDRGLLLFGEGGVHRIELPR